MSRLNSCDDTTGLPAAQAGRVREEETPFGRRTFERSLRVSSHRGRGGISVATTTVLWKEGMHFCTHVKSGELLCDESSEVGTAYPSAPELLMASLGSCIGSVLVYFADRHDINLEGMQIDLDWEMTEGPRRISRIDIGVIIPAHLDDEALATLERVAGTCLIHNTLLHPPQIGLALQGSARRPPSTEES
jgi:putative redox protein